MSPGCRIVLDRSPLAATPRGALDMTPEIRGALDAELADQTSNGRVPRAILGRYLQWLFYVGETWLTARMTSIFPQSDEQLRGAAWLGHLSLVGLTHPPASRGP